MFERLIGTSFVVLFLLCSCTQKSPSDANQKITSAVTPPFTSDQALVIASSQLDLERVKKLLKDGANPDARLGIHDADRFVGEWSLSYSQMGSDQWTPLLAVANSYPLLQSSQRADVFDRKIVDERNRRRVAIATLLIAKNANLDLDDGYGATPLDASIYHGFDSLSLLLIESGANTNTKTGIYIDGTGDITPLHRATDSPLVLKALLEHGAEVGVKDSTGDTPLHWAARSQSVDSVRLLLAAGTDVNAKDNEGKTPLYWVNSSARINPPDDATKEIEKLLRDAGADP